MFTGIISHLGEVTSNQDNSLRISSPLALFSHLTLGMSIAVNGICLTVTKQEDPHFFYIDFMPETAQKTTIQYLKKGMKVNLELPATPNTFLAGHVVQGHVDAVSKIINIEEEGNSHLFTFSLKPSISRYLVDKGSIAVNGISLTVITATKDNFTVGIIPHTWSHTMLHQLKPGDHVNIEVDVLAKYVEKMIANNK
ncbi:MAG: riboflavin synthase [Patescibacteria group bacterium]